MNKSFEIKFFDAVDHNELHEVNSLLKKGGDVNAELLPGGWTEHYTVQWIEGIRKWWNCCLHPRPTSMQRLKVAKLHYT